MAVEEPADRAGPYLLCERLGEGGMGVVYRAADDAGRQVALKLLRTELARDMTFRRRLAREVDTMRRVRSSYVAEVLDADVAAERPYIATRFIDGQPLDDAVAEAGPLSGPALVRVATGLTSAISAIHEAGVVHRDLKPNNVMLVDGAPVVIDFGIAHAADTTRLTQTGMIVGTPGYMAPEIIDGSAPGPAIDVYAWAATVAFAATGRSPFGTGSLESVLARILAGRPDLAGVPPRLETILRAALAREPERRPSPGQITAWLSDPVLLTAPAPAPPPASPMPVPPPMLTPAPAPVSPVPPVLPMPTPPPAPTLAVGGRPRVSLGWYKLLAYLAVVCAVAATSMLPVVGAIACVLAVWYLRAGDSALRSRRLPINGARDLALAPFRQPRARARATALVVPSLMYAGGAALLVGGGLLCGAAAGHDYGVGAITQWAAAAFAYVTLAPPGSQGPRRQLVRLLSAVVLDRRTAGVTGLVLAGVAVLACAVAWWALPYWAPFSEPYDPLRQLVDALRKAFGQD